MKPQSAKKYYWAEHLIVLCNDSLGCRVEYLIVLYNDLVGLREEYLIVLFYDLVGLRVEYLIVLYNHSLGLGRVPHCALQIDKKSVFWICLPYLL